MRKDDKFYYLYCHTNKINGKKYIGISVQSPSRRWRKDGKGYDGCPKFYNAIQKYGWENFEHEILLTQLTYQEASDKEKEYIIKYDTINNGYNILNGGLDNSENGGVLFHTRQINQYSLDKKLVKTWDSIADIERTLHISHQSISRACLKQIYTVHNYIWRYVDDCDDINDIIIKKIYCQHNTENTQQRPINQYDLNGNFIQQWDSILEVSNTLNKATTLITNCCNRKHKHKTAYGYQWRYADDCDDISQLKYYNDQIIYEVDKNNNIIHTFDNIKAIKQFYNSEKLWIADVLCGKHKQTNGHIFIYANKYKRE